MNINIKKTLAGLAAVGLLAFASWQILLLSKAPAVLNAALDFARQCESGEKSYCIVAVSTARNLERQLRFIPKSQEMHFVDAKTIASLRTEILPRITPLAERQQREQQEEHEALLKRANETIGLIAANQKAQQEDAEKLKARYLELAAPKLLYRCGDRTNLIAGSGPQNYNDIFEHARVTCTANRGELEVLKSEK